MSYASEDANAAVRICEALRGAGIEVWFDQSELRGGDAWDQKIRREIHDCALFIAIVSQHTQERLEGYFRHEWKLAIERAHHMAEQKPFLVPVVVDATRDQDAIVPDLFKEVQWTRLPEGETHPEFVTRIQQLMSGESGHSPTLARTSAVVPSGRLSRLKPARLAVAVVLAALAAYLLAEKPWTVKPAPPPSKQASSAETPTAFNPPPHSIAVLPFVNLSGDKDQEYFSDGLTEELLNSLARINELQVSARTSSFSFKGKDTDIGTIARKLNVSAVLEGSVRRSGNTVRVTAELINADTGFHLWSETYDRDLGDVLKLQTNIASAVARALKVTLLGNLAAKIELGGTRNPAAFDAYLRGWKLYGADTHEQMEASIAAFSEAIRLDPNYALAFAARSRILNWYSGTWASLKEKDAHGAAIQALADARQAVTLVPDLADGHVALASAQQTQLNFIGASEEYRKALALGPGYARAWRDYSSFASAMGDSESALSAAHRALVLDPLNDENYLTRAVALEYGRRYKEALAASQEWRDRLTRNDWWYIGYHFGMLYYELGDYQRAANTCNIKGPVTPIQFCLALAYHRLGRHADAEASRARMFAAVGNKEASTYADIYAQWGDTADALWWLETAWRLRDPGLQYLKVDPFLDPFRKEPRFQAIERKLKFPN